MTLAGATWAASTWGADAGAPIVSKEAIEQALQAPPASSTPEIRTRGLRLQARPEAQSEAKGEAAGGASGAGGGRAIDLQIAFALNSSALLPEAQAQLRALAGALSSASLAGQHFELAGHTDATGNAEANRRLSLARAGAVRDYLAGAGVAMEQLSVAGHGADRPLPGIDPRAAANRRVEVRVKEPSP
jgi:outer membrane protein OmpA-like peptidoglycan-associated protein